MALYITMTDKIRLRQAKLDEDYDPVKNQPVRYEDPHNIQGIEESKPKKPTIQQQHTQKERIIELLTEMDSVPVNLLSGLFPQYNARINALNKDLVFVGKEIISVRVDGQACKRLERIFDLKNG